MSGTSLIQQFVKQGKELEQERSEAKYNEAEAALSTFFAGLDEKPDLSKLDALITFLKNATGAGSSQLALGGGSQTETFNSADAAANFIVNDQRVPVSVRNLLNRTVLLPATDKLYLALNDDGTPTIVKQLEDQVTDSKKAKDTAEGKVTDLEKQVTDLEQQNARLKTAPPATLPLDTIQTSAQQIHDLLEKAKEPGLSATMNPKKFRVLSTSDLDEAKAAADTLLDPNKVKKNDGAPKANH